MVVPSFCLCSSVKADTNSWLLQIRGLRFQAQGDVSIADHFLQFVVSCLDEGLY